MENLKINQNNRQDQFVHLHCHDTYSFVDGFGTPKQYAEKCAKIGQSALGTTNHGNVSNHFKHYEECQKNNIKPILGCEFYIEPDVNISNQRYYHITVLSKNNEGYRNLLLLLTTSYQQSNGKPIVKLNDLFNHQKGLIILSGCASSRINHILDSNNFDKAEKELINFKNSIEHFYIEMIPFVPKKNNLIKLYGLSERLKIPMIATMDCHYVNKEQSIYQEILLCIQSNDQMNNPNRWKFDQNDFYLKTRKEMEESFKKIVPKLNLKSAFDNTLKIADMIDFKFPIASSLVFPIEGQDKKDKLYQMCTDGMKMRNLIGKKNYEERMEYEFDLIVKKNYIDYFLIFADLVNWAKNNSILVGPARGSSAGSLICYLTKITEVDPIIHNLIFERFIDINREDLPDIDVDFEDEKRPLVKQYLENKYGKDKVGQLATFSTFKGKSIIGDFGRIYQLPYGVETKLKSIIIERSGGDSRASFTIEDTFKQFDLAKQYLKEYPFLIYAKEFEGQLRNMSSHASGIIMSNEPLNNFCAIYKNKGETVISIDYHDASKIGLVKFDILGLNTLTSIAKAIELIKKRTGKEIDIYNLTLNDKKVYEGFKNPKKLFGIFQFDGQAVNQVCRQVLPETFEELTAINALSRPGPMHGKDLDLDEPITSVYIARKWGDIPWKTSHKLLENITKDTQGVVIYQEQVMRTMREIGDMSWKDTAEIRKLISRSMGVERFNNFKEKFAQGAKKKGLTEQEIDQIWLSICTFGCLSGDTILKLPQSNQYSPKKITLKKLFENGGVSKIASDKGNTYIQKNRKVKLLIMKENAIQTERMIDIYESGIKITYEILTRTNKKIRATKNHLFYTLKGWKKLSELQVYDFIAIKGKKFPSKKFKGCGSGAHNIRHGQSKLFLSRQKFLRNKYKLCQVCFTNQNEETHHKDENRLNNNWENLAPICRKCHKKTYPTPIPFQKGYQINFERIEAIWKPKKEMTYDIAMPFPWNNYLANDFIVHNSWAFNKSHSVSYSIISYWTMWLKVYYPIEYYVAMVSTMFNEGKIKKIIKEYLREGYQLLSFDINKSKESFIIDENNLRLGFKQIKGLGSLTAEKIVSNQPYKSIDDFEYRTKIGKKITNLLSKLGAFNSIGGSQKVIKTLFGNVTENKYENQITFQEKLKISPLSVDFNIVEEWMPFVKKHIKWRVSKIEFLDPKKNTETIMGIVYDKNLKDKIEEAVTRGKIPPPIKNGQSKYCNFMIEDDTDFVTCRISTANFEKFKKLIFEEINDDSIILVKGRMGEGIRMFFANEIVHLDRLKEKIDKKINDPFTDSELVLMGKLWKKLK